MLDCPLSGSGSQALVRDVLVSGSGDKLHTIRSSAAPRALPTYLDPFGNGTKMKFVANLLVSIHTAAAAEASTIARKVGLDPAQMFEVVADGASGSRALPGSPLLILNAAAASGDGDQDTAPVCGTPPDLSLEPRTAGPSQPPSLDLDFSTGLPHRSVEHFSGAPCLNSNGRKRPTQSPTVTSPAAKALRSDDRQPGAM